MANPFDDPDASFTVLSNSEGQHSLWPASAPAPAGWRAVHGPSGREACLDYVEANWKDLRPLSLTRTMRGDGVDTE
ncbi:MbtH family protein [Streptomyces sp. NPDC047079]|uniref:MbtH family protein n=1 Tax=Streptomyces sp. NPDC047079 TaxID=3154607 RepID=UPI0033DA7DD2